MSNLSQSHEKSSSRRKSAKKKKAQPTSVGYNPHKRGRKVKAQDGSPSSSKNEDSPGKNTPGGNSFFQRRTSDAAEKASVFKSMNEATKIPTA